MTPSLAKIQTACFVFRFVPSKEELILAFDTVGRQFEPPVTHEDRRYIDLESRFPSDRPLMLIASTNNTIIGGIFGFRQDPGAIMRLIAVDSSFRRMGIGRWVNEHTGKIPPLM